MGTLELLKELEKKATPLPWNENTALKWSHDFKLTFEMRNALPKLLAMIEAGDALAEAIAIRRRNELFGDTCDLGQALIKYRKQRLEFEEK